jgi:DNA-binding response OmpR family regulator
MTPAAVASAPPLRDTLAIDAEARSASIEGAELYLGEREFTLLSAVVSAPGRFVTYAELLEGDFSGIARVNAATIERYAQRLQRKLELRGMEGALRCQPNVGLELEAPGEEAGRKGAERWAPIC